MCLRPESLAKQMSDLVTWVRGYAVLALADPSTRDVHWDVCRRVCEVFGIDERDANDESTIPVWLSRVVEGELNDLRGDLKALDDYRDAEDPGLDDTNTLPF